VRSIRCAALATGQEHISKQIYYEKV